MAERIIDVDAKERYIRDYGTYSIYAIGTRVSPSFQDGLIQVQRRIVYGMFAETKAVPGKKVKSARVYGDIMGKFHPHGDSAIYDAMDVLAVPWKSMIPLIEPHGGWGTIDGDKQSAGRYTECNMSQFAYDFVIGNLKESKHIVNWVDTYTNQDKEPEFLPVKIPLLLVNGGSRIGVGMKFDASKHNLKEVLIELKKKILNPNHVVFLKPDMCQPCQIINTNWKALCNTGFGSYKVRGLMEVTTITPDISDNKKYKNKPAIKITSTPDYVTLNKIKEDIEKRLVEEKKCPQIIDIIDDNGDDKSEEECNKQKINCYIVLENGSDPKYVMDMIYKHTDMQSTFTENFQVLYEYNTTRWSYNHFMEKWIEWDKLTYTKYYYSLMQQYKTKLYEKEAFIKAIQSDKIDELINRIRKRKTTDSNENIEWVIKTLGIGKIQARFILSSRLETLSEGYLNKYIQEAKKLTNEINILRSKILDENLLIQDIIKDIDECIAKYGKPRNCTFIDESEINDIPKGTFKLVITEKNFIKKIPVNDNIGSLRDDRAKQILTVENTESIFIFDCLGKVYKLPISKIPVSDKGTNGIDVRLMIKNLTSNITKVIYQPLLEDLRKKVVKHFLMIQSKNGYIKKLDIGDIIGAMPSGLVYTKLSENDYVNDIEIVPEGMDIIVYSDNKALRYNSNEVPQLKRNTIGNKSIKSDYIDGLCLITPVMTNIIVITEKGYINRFSSVALQPQSRAKNQGSSVIKLGAGDKIKYIFGCKDDSIIHYSTQEVSDAEIPVSDLKIGSSVSTGKRLIKDNIVKCVVK